MTTTTTTSTATARLQSRKFTVTNLSDKITLACTQWFVLDAERQQKQEQFAENVVVMAHQMGKLGGSGVLMRGIATHIVRMMYAKKMAGVLGGAAFDAVHFDLRGVGASAGSPTLTCFEEVGDLKAVISHLVAVEGVKNIYLVGSSAGACVAGSALNSPGVRAGGFIALPYGYAASILFSTHYPLIKASPLPKFFVHGDSDGFTSNSQFLDLIKSCAGGVNEYEIIKGGHFEIEGPEHDEGMARKFADFFAKIHLQQQPPKSDVNAASSG